MDVSWWLDVKRALVTVTSLERDALHIYAALAIVLATAATTRWRLREWRVLVPLIVLEATNEAADLIYEIWPPADRAMQYWASVHDFVNTMAVPVIVVLIARRLSLR